MVSLFGVFYWLVTLIIFTYTDFKYRVFLAGSGIFIQHLTDDCDGLLARSRKLTSKKGEFLDHGADRLIFLMIYFVGVRESRLLLSLEFFTGCLKLYGNLKSQHMKLDSTGEWIRLVGAAHQMIFFMVPVMYEYVSYLYYYLAFRQFVFQCKWNINYKNISENICESIVFYGVAFLYIWLFYQSDNFFELFTYTVLAGGYLTQFAYRIVSKPKGQVWNVNGLNDR
eukprot:UN33625